MRNAIEKHNGDANDIKTKNTAKINIFMENKCMAICAHLRTSITVTGICNYINIADIREITHL